MEAGRCFDQVVQTWALGSGLETGYKPSDTLVPSLPFWIHPVLPFKSEQVCLVTGLAQIFVADSFIETFSPGPKARIGQPLGVVAFGDQTRPPLSSEEKKNNWPLGGVNPAPARSGLSEPRRHGTYFQLLALLCRNPWSFQDVGPPSFWGGCKKKRQPQRGPQTCPPPCL